MKTSLALLLSLLVLSAFRAESQGVVTLSIANIKQTGPLQIGLFTEGGEFPDDKYRVQSALRNCTGYCTITFDAVPYGDYAIAIFQDVNGNGKLDTGLFGIPSEPFAFSNDFRPKFRGPSFEKCKFTVSTENREIKIQLINSLFGDN